MKETYEDNAEEEEESKVLNKNQETDKKLEQKVENKLERPKGKKFAEQATGSGFGTGYGNKESWGQGGGYAWAGKAPAQGAPNPADFLQKPAGMPDFPQVSGHTTGSGGYQNSGGVQRTGGEQAAHQSPAPAPAPATGDQQPSQQQAQAAPPPGPSFLPPIPQSSPITNSVKGQPVKGVSVGLKTTDYNGQRGNSDVDEEEIEQDQKKTPLQQSDAKKQPNGGGLLKNKKVASKYLEADDD